MDAKDFEQSTHLLEKYIAVRQLRDMSTATYPHMKQKDRDKVFARVDKVVRRIEDSSPHEVSTEDLARIIGGGLRG